MKLNEGTPDRVIRVVLAVAAVVGAAAVGVSSAVGIVLLAVAAVLGVTAVVGFCPLYALLGISTRRAAVVEKPVSSPAAS